MINIPYMQNYIKKLYENRQGYFCLPCMNHSTGKWEQTNSNFFYFPNDFDKALKFIEAENLYSKSVYFTPSLYEGKGSTLKKNVSNRTWVLFADIDEHEKPENIDPKATFIWETSPGRYQAIWKLDEPILWDEAESVNHQLTSAIGVDSGGWARNKVLRIPGSINYKYDPPYQGKIIWDNGPEYSLQEIKDTINYSYTDADLKQPRKDLVIDELPSSMSIMEKYTGIIPNATLELLRSIPASEQDDWSSKIWALENQLADAGLSMDEVFVLVNDSPWNKYKRDGRPDEHLWAEVKKVFQQKNTQTKNESALLSNVCLRLTPEDPLDTFTIDWKDLFPQAPSLISPDGLVMRKMSDIEEEQVSFLWYPYLPLGKLTILEGDPGDGKTFVALKIAACISSGDQLPGNEIDFSRTIEIINSPGRAIYMSNEDSFADTLKPRLALMGANQNNIFSVEGRVDKDGKPLPFTLEDLPTIDKMLCAYKPLLLIIDPIQSYFGSSRDTHKAAQVRPVMDGIAKLAEKHKCAILILRHLTKRKSDKAIYRGLDSIDFMAAVRSALQVVSDPENPDDEVAKIKNRAIVHIKASTTGVGPSLLYRIEPSSDDPMRGAFTWMGISNLKTGDLEQEEDPVKGKSAITDAIEFLLDNVERGADGSLAEDIKKLAKKSGLAPMTLRRARETLQKQYDRNPEKGGIMITQAMSGNPSRWRIIDPIKSGGGVHAQ